MFEKELRTALVHFNYPTAVALCVKLCDAEVKDGYEVSDIEDELYWKLMSRLEAHEATFLEEWNNA